MQAAIVVIVFGAVCGLCGYLVAWDQGYWKGYAQGKRVASVEGPTTDLSLPGLAAAFDDLICEHPQPPNMDGYYQLLRDIAEIPEVKIPPEWE